MTSAQLSRAAALAAVCLVFSPAYGEDFYKGKTISIFVGSGAGGGFDTYAARRRAASGQRHSRQAIRKSAEPAGCWRTRQCQPLVQYRSAGRNSHWRTWPMAGAGASLGATGRQVRSAEFSFWLISLGREVSTCVFFNKSGVTDIEALKKKGKVAMGTSGPTSPMASDALLIAHALNLKLNLVSGFKGSRQAFMASEQGELDGNCGLWYSSLQAQYMGPVKEGKANVTLQLGRKPHPGLKGVPFLYDVVKLSDVDRKAMDLVFTQMETGPALCRPSQDTGRPRRHPAKGISGPGQGSRISGHCRQDAAGSGSRPRRGDPEFSDLSLWRIRKRSSKRPKSSSTDKDARFGLKFPDIAYFAAFPLRGFHIVQRCLNSVLPDALDADGPSRLCRKNKNRRGI